jgi:hypothetical protein
LHRNAEKKEKMPHCKYGVIARIQFQGVSPELDECHLDGWYAVRGHAEEVFELFKKRYPHADVFVVEQIEAEWRGMHEKLPDATLQAIRENHRGRCKATGT